MIFSVNCIHFGKDVKDEVNQGVSAIIVWYFGRGVGA